MIWSVSMLWPRTYAVPLIMSCILSYHVLPFTRGGPGLRRSSWQPPGRVGRKPGRVFYLPLPLLTKEGESQHFFVLSPPCGVHDAQKHEFIRSCVLDMLQALRRHVHNL